jgi:hypothetical protein
MCMPDSARAGRYAESVLQEGTVARYAGFYGAIELKGEVAVVSRCVWFALSKGRLPRRQSVVVGRGDGQQRSQSAQSPKRPYRPARSTSSYKAHALSQNP